MFKKTTAAIILSAVIMAGSSVSAFAEAPVQTVVVEQEYAASAAKTWDGKAALKAGQKYVIKKNVTVSGKVTLPKGTTLTVKKGAKLTIGSKGALTVKGTLSVKSGATLAVSGTLTTAKGSKLTDAGTIKFAKTAKVTLGGKLTVSYVSLLTIAACGVIMIGLTTFVNKSKMGKAMRACSEDKSAAQLMGIDVNTTDKSQWEAALQALLEQRPLVKAYVMDEIYNMMESGEAAVASYYAGDYFTMCDAQAENVDLQFYYPDETNYFIDAMCIPSCCQDQELAECFINFMLSQETAVANAEYIYYASPNSLVYNDETYQEDMGEEAMEILYPEGVNFSEEYNKLAYRNLDDEMLSYMNSLWENLKIN